MNGNIKKTLTLSLKKQWFEMTKSGIKTEDYREINYYWINRFFNIKNIIDGDSSDLIENFKNKSFYKESEDLILNRMNVNRRYFAQNTMTLGYPKSSDTERIIKYEHKGIEIRTGNPEWGAEPNKLYFVILHGAILE